MRLLQMIATGAMLTLVAGVAAAQERPRMETGVLVSAPGGELIGLGTRVGVSVTPQSTLEGGAEWMDLGRTRHYADQIVWIYYIQGRRAIGSGRWPDPEVFITYGATGFAERTTRPQGMTLFYVPPLLPTAGLGWQSASRGRVTLRVDAQSLWLVGEYLVVPRFTVGLSLHVP